MPTDDVSIEGLTLLYRIRRAAFVQRFDATAGRQLVRLGLAELKQDPFRIELTQKGQRSPLGHRA